MKSGHFASYRARHRSALLNKESCPLKINVRHTRKPATHPHEDTCHSMRTIEMRPWRQERLRRDETAHKGSANVPMEQPERSLPANGSDAKGTCFFPPSPHVTRTPVMCYSPLYARRIARPLRQMPSRPEAQPHPHKRKAHTMASRHPDGHEM